MARRYNDEGRSVGAAQNWALSYFEAAGAFLASWWKDRFPSADARTGAGRPLYLEYYMIRTFATLWCALAATASTTALAPPTTSRAMASRS